MATNPVQDDIVEHCSPCAEQTPHAAYIELRTESAKETNAEYSREPYRIVRCTVCGERTSQRMNDA